MGDLIRYGNVLFGKGDDDFPIWLLTIRINILLMLALWVVLAAWGISRGDLKRLWAARRDVAFVIALTAIAAVFRFLLVRNNLFDHGGIPYSRMLLGYKGYFAAAQSFSLFYQLTSRTIEQTIVLDRVLSTLTVALAYVLCRVLVPQRVVFAVITALLMATYPLHILFAASDTLSVFSVFLLTASYLLLAIAVGTANERRSLGTTLLFSAAFLGLSLLTQVRYENLLFLLPPAIYLFVQRRRLQVSDLMPGVVLFVAFTGTYVYWAFAAGYSYQSQVALSTGFAVAQRHILWNPFLSIPVLLVGTLAATVGLKPSLKLLPLMLWLVVFLLTVWVGDVGEHAARVYSNWLLLIFAFAGYGFSLLMEGGWLGKMVAGTFILWLVAQPIVLRDALTAQYLEIAENDYFRSLWLTLPPDVRWVVVPDDELMSRISHTALETLTKYGMIRAGRGAGTGDAQVVGITAFLEHPDRVDCSNGQCAFFFGLPCMEQTVYPFTAEQCQELLRTRQMSVLSEMTLVGALFADCNIYTGKLREQLCDPATKPRRLALYRIES